MCTVTFIPQKKSVFITHNRDEKSSRSKADHPKEYSINGHTLLFPRDSAAGGTWIAVTKNGDAAVLLNGGFIKHISASPYKKSRGLAFLDIIAADDPFTSYQNTDLINIEPFTVIIWSNHILYECRWDGRQKYISKPAPDEPHTWSSVTLYDDTIIAKRKEWFDNWLPQKPLPAMQDIVDFHLSAGDGDKKNDLRMNRNDQLLTVSLTSLRIDEEKAEMLYMDLKDDTSTLTELEFIKAPVLQ